MCIRDRSDIFRANNPYGEEGRGSTFTPTDSSNLIANTLIAANTPGSITQQRFSEIGSLTGQGTQVTAGSLLKGLVPNILRRGGGSGARRLNPSGSRSQQQQLEELLINQQQPNTTTPTQTGTSPNNLSQIQREAYLNQLRTYGFDPSYFARFLSPARSAPPRFRNVFNRNSFA